MTTAVLSAPTDAFHVAGTDVSDAATALDALEAAGLTGMDLRKVELYNGSGQLARGRWGLQTADGSMLPGISVGDGYEVINYEQTAATLDAVARRTGATFDTIGSLGALNSRAWISMRLPEPVAIGDDKMMSYIVALMGHGNSANVLLPSSVRVFCANQQPQLHREANKYKYKIVIRHTTNAAERLALAEEALVSSVDAMSEMAHMGAEMRNISFTTDQFLKAIDLVYPLGGDSKSAKTRYENRVDAIRGIHNSPTTANIRDTAWGAYQAMIEYDQWHRSVRNADDDEDSIIRARARRSLLGGSVVASQIKAFEVVRDLAGLTN